MKKNLPFSLFIFFTVFAGIFCITAYQRKSFQFKTFRIYYNPPKKPACLTIINSPGKSINTSRKNIAGLAGKTSQVKHGAGTPGNRVADHLMMTESCNRVICLSRPGDQYKECNNLIEEIPAKEARDVGSFINDLAPGFFDNFITYKYKKGNDIIVNQDGRAGIFLDGLDFEFTKFSGKNLANSHPISVSQKTEG